MNIVVFSFITTTLLDDRKQYSVFDELPPGDAPNEGSRFHRIIYYVFAIYFIVISFARWASFFAYKKLAILGDLPPVNSVNFPYLLSAISCTAIILSSIVLFIRRSMRAAIALLIFGAILELIFAQFMRN